MKALPKRKGNLNGSGLVESVRHGLNESPSEKEGKSLEAHTTSCSQLASMKALPKRKGNVAPPPPPHPEDCLNESPSEKEGKCGSTSLSLTGRNRLNESPSEKEGK